MKNKEKFDELIAGYNNMSIPVKSPVPPIVVNNNKEKKIVVSVSLSPSLADWLKDYAWTISMQRDRKISISKVIEQLIESEKDRFISSGETLNHKPKFAK